ncbi:ABC transporter substrate-binding protein [Paenibacillus chitinolyticus]|uniref:ABC transporter substrate-binding protein n=1 Tax=Paenibacillus chitinolyticus TaxID=79263 RepID=UPI00366D749F
MKRMLLLITTLLLLTTTAVCGGWGRTQAPDSGGTSRGENKNGKKTVIVSMLFLDEVFREAKKKFEQKHPDVEIRLTYVQTKDNWKVGDQERFIKSTNAEMLSGKGPDVLVLDPLPMGKYASSNALVNLSRLMDQDPSFHKDLYFGNILDNLHINGVLYGMPMRFMLETMVGDEGAVRKAGVGIDDTVWTWNEFAETAKAMKKNGFPAAYAASPPSMLKAMVKADYPSFVDEPNGKAKFDQASFIKLLNEVKALFDGKVIADKPAVVSFKSAYIQNPEEFFSFPRALYKQPKLYRSPLAVGQKPGGFYMPEQILGINENSTVKMEAWAFIKFMLSDDIQGVNGLGGFPLNKDVYGRQLDQVLKNGKVKIEDGPEEGGTVDVSPADIEYQKELISGLSNPIPTNTSMIEDVLLKESKAFFTGQKSAEEVAKEIQDRANTYLNE